MGQRQSKSRRQQRNARAPAKLVPTPAAAALDSTTPTNVLSSSTSPQEAKFEYLPLSVERKEIRLAQAVTDHDDGPIKLSLRTVSLLSNPQYSALSYTWGAPYAGLEPEWDDPSATKTILINGCPFPVRWNLWAALHRFCSARHAGAVLWIDALCINQADVDERSAQVGLMADIYHGAACTWAWLGPDSSDSALAFAAVADLAAAGERRRTREILGDLFVGLAEAGEYRRCADDELGHPDMPARLAAIQSLLKRNWWMRAWIIQEAALSDETKFYVGQHDVASFVDLYYLTGILTQHYFMVRRYCPEKYLLLEPHLYRAQTALGVGFNHILEFKLKYDRELKICKLDLKNALAALLAAKATDPRDKVFAAQSLTQDRDLITVDYRSDVVDVFARVARRWIEEKRNLKIMSFCSPSPLVGLPSWAVDWSNHRVYPDTFPDARTDPEDLVRGTLPSAAKKDLYRAGHPFQLMARFDDTGRILVLRGIVVDKISYVCADTGPEDGINDFRQDSRADSSPPAQSSIVGDPAVEKFTLMQLKAEMGSWTLPWLCDDALRGRVSPDVLALPESPEDIMRSGGWKTNVTYVLTGEPLLAAFRRTLMADLYRPQNHAFSRRLMNWLANDAGFESHFRLAFSVVMRGRRFVATEKGLLGLAPNAVRTDDVVCVAMGCEMPLVLRPCGDGRFTYVGQCYVHGIMDGEAWAKFAPVADGEGLESKMDAIEIV